MFSSRTKVWLFLLGICFALLAFGDRWGGRGGLFAGLLLAIGLNILVFFWGESRILSALNARLLSGRDPWTLHEKVDDLAKKFQMTAPQIYLVESPTATAFSMGFSGGRPTLGLTTSLLEKFSSEEVDMVLAQQMSHISRTDSFGFGVSSIISNSLLGIGQALDKLWPPNFFLGKKQRPFLNFLSIFSWAIIRFVAKLSTYVEDDRVAAELKENRELLAEVLWKLEGLAQTRPLTVPPATSHLFIVNPEGFQQRNFFLRAHPPIQERLRALVGTPTV